MSDPVVTKKKKPAGSSSNGGILPTSREAPAQKVARDEFFSSKDSLPKHVVDFTRPLRKARR